MYEYLPSNSRQTMHSKDIEVFYHSDTGAILPRATPHYHEHYEVYMFLGEPSIDYMVEGHIYSLQKGDILLFPPSTLHQPMFSKTEEAILYNRMVLWIHSSWWQRLVAKYPEADFCFRCCQERESYLLRCNRATWQGIFASLHQTYMEEKRQKLAYDLCAQAQVLALMVQISRALYYQDQPQSAQDKRHELLSDVILYIHEHVKEKITLDRIAGEYVTSKTTICSMFQEQLGTTVYQYIIQRRLLAAKNNILAGMPISKAWEGCGFNDYSTFFRAFKNEYGLSPREFRKSNYKPGKEKCHVVTGAELP